MHTIKSLQVIEDHRFLKLTLKDGRAVEVSAARLRSCAMDAVSRRDRLERGRIDLYPNLKIQNIRRMGSSGVNITFSDGHHRAIYPFTQLEKIALAINDDSADN